MNFQWQEGNEVELLINGEGFFPSVFECIRSAEKEILLETFIIFDDRVGRALKAALLEAAARGVQIDLTVDGYGTAELNSEFITEMAKAGIRMHMFDPAPRVLGMRTNLFRRLHRKIVVIDGEIGFIGGINFGADHMTDYGAMAKQDYSVKVRGPIVADLHRAALDLVRRSPAVGSDLPAVKPVTRHVGAVRMLLAIRDNEQHHTDIEEHYLKAIRSANYRLVVANAYFFPGYRILRELRNAARRGVKVTLILQGQPDKAWVSACSHLLYNYLLRDGVTIREYCQRPLHGKVALADREWCTVGSSNLDPLSLSLNLEANLFIRDPALNQQLYDHLMELSEAQCQAVTQKIALRGFWWRAPLISLSFHFIRRFPALAGMLPAHTPKLQPLTTEEAVEQLQETGEIPCSNEKT
ncbi:cardiolipin synthase ClsB [Halopseudomonas nanhaiensis]|uniref:cardiolipin synthase ClsB n=1 Tax=Halopseudomonas nanhaiensis TaxID=2830842 RepID=UPI001CBF00C8|nr:cardiolipin synthase ClsB [Halopseudomonas nanhaiensis]UAW97747.1 cardiolipin synthase ClsB [Halopseudomonas nanhaiensis]